MSASRAAQPPRFPLRIVEVPEKPQEGILKVGAFKDNIYLRSRGGTTLVYRTFSESRELGSLIRETHDYWAGLHPIEARRLIRQGARRALDRLIRTGADSVQSLYPVGKMHPLWMRTLSGPTGVAEVVDQFAHGAVDI